MSLRDGGESARQVSAYARPPRARFQPGAWARPRHSPPATPNLRLPGGGHPAILRARGHGQSSIPPPQAPRRCARHLVDQYQTSTDPRNGITNDPNRADEPDYIVKLIAKVITVSRETQKLIAALPPLETNAAAPKV